MAGDGQPCKVNYIRPLPSQRWQQFIFIGMDPYSGYGCTLQVCHVSATWVGFLKALLTITSAVLLTKKLIL